MGLCIDHNDEPALGNLEIEIRSRSFRLIGKDFDVEFDTKDIPKIRLALDLIEKHERSRS